MDLEAQKVQEHTELKDTFQKYRNACDGFCGDEGIVVLAAVFAANIRNQT
jgi:hypothetical protein